MKHLLFLLCGVVFGLSGCDTQSRIERRAAAVEPAGETGKVMTFNICYGTANDGEDHWDYRKEMVFDLIAGHGADVVGLQEALDFQVSEIRRAVQGYGVVTAGRDDGLQAGEHCTILYRRDRFRAADSGTFWFSNSPWVPGSMHWGNRIPRICTWVRLVERETGNAFCVYNLHLDHQSQESRFKSAQLLARRVAAREPKDPVVVMGDFNMGLDNPGMLYLRRLGYPDGPVELLDTWRLMQPDAPDTRTYHGFKGGTEGVKIDQILVERTSEVLAAEIDRTTNEEGRYPSDHYPVTATLKLWNNASSDF